MKPVNKNSDEKMNSTNTDIICIFDSADVATTVGCRIAHRLFCDENAIYPLFSFFENQ